MGIFQGGNAALTYLLLVVWFGRVMTKGPLNRRIGVVKQRLSDEECPYPGTSSELLSKFLRSVDFNIPKPPKSWECNPLYRQLKRRLQGTIQMAQVEEILWEKYRQASIMSSYASMQSTATMSSSQTISVRDPDPQHSCSTADSTEEQLWWIKQTAQARKEALHSYSNPPDSRKASQVSEIVPEEEILKEPPAKKAKQGLEGLQGMWKLSWDEPVRMLDLCKLMDFDQNEIDQREKHIELEVPTSQDLRFLSALLA